ncbi:ampG permease [Vibrio ishigakensis]|uniref:AmpG permease n=1 Tax=Vibrio ishigakensis TaxID=1481914 RepID=A0A0B8QU08_9VIBR|nr:ampG permease [Vibrio ishigakensis]
MDLALSGGHSGCTLGIAGVDPAKNLMFTSMLALCIAIASATKDVAIDAYRIDTFPKSEPSKLPQASAWP